MKITVKTNESESDESDVGCNNNNGKHMLYPFDFPCIFFFVSPQLDFLVSWFARKPEPHKASFAHACFASIDLSTSGTRNSRAT